MPRLNTMVKRNKYVLRHRQVSETSNSGNSDSSILQNNMAETDSVTSTKSENSACSLNTDYSSDEYDEHNYSFRNRSRAQQSCNTRSVFKDSSNVKTQSKNLAAENVNLNEDKINMGLNISSRIIDTSSKHIRSRSNKSMPRSSTTNEYFEIMNTSKQSNKSLSKNAINAKMNRIKKKQYILQLENEITFLKGKNTNLQSCIDCNMETISSLKNEVKYFRSILANSKELGTILRNVCRNTNLDIISPLDRTSSNKFINSQEINANVDIDMANGLEADNFVSGTYLYSPPYSPDVPESPFKPLHPQPIIDSYDDVLLNMSEPNNYHETPLNDPLFDCFQFDLLEMDDDVLKYESLHNEESDGFMLWEKSPLEVNDVSNFDFSEDAGVCLHVSNKKVSLEFCASCNQGSTKCNAENLESRLLSE